MTLLKVTELNWTSFLIWIGVVAGVVVVFLATLFILSRFPYKPKK
jgi:hypothetical protein